MTRLRLVVNPHAARHRRRPELVHRYVRLLGEEAVTVTQDLEALDRWAATVAADPPEVVAISGGDGTLSLTLSALRAHFGARPLPPILLLAGGTMNMVAHSVATHRDPVRILAAVREAPAEALVLRRRDTLEVEDRVGFIFGFGLVTNFLERYYEGPGRGPRKAAQVLAQAILSVIKRDRLFERLFQRAEAELRWSGPSPGTGSGAWTAVLVQTIENLGIGFRPCYRALEAPDTAHMLATTASPATLVNHLAYIWRGRPWPAGLIEDHLVAELAIAPAAPLAYTLDGELYRHETGSLRLRIGTAVTFAAP